MMRRSLLWLCGSAALLAVVAAVPKAETPRLMSETAQAFLASLTPEQRQKAQLTFQDEDRFFFHFIPTDDIEKRMKRTRKGVPIRELTTPQRHLAHAMLSAAVSRRGYIKAVSIMSLEDVLRVIEGDSGERRNPEKYFFSIFGEPSENGIWGFRVEGHHISLHFTILRDRVIGNPTFFGANPAMVPSGPRKGLRVLAREEDLGRTLVASLTPEQRKIAIVAEKAYPDILTSANRRAALEGQPDGLAASKLNAAQKRMLVELLGEYADNLPQDAAASRHQQIQSTLDKMHFAWAGGVEKGDPHYYRVQAPDFLVEYDDTQNKANHIHSVWRDFRNDWGEDLLRLHYESSHKR